MCGKVDISAPGGNTSPPPLRKTHIFYVKIFPFKINNFGHFFLFTIGIIESILPFSPVTVIIKKLYWNHMIVWVLEDYRKSDWKLRHDKAFTSVSVGKKRATWAQGVQRRWKRLWGRFWWGNHSSVETETSPSKEQNQKTPKNSKKASSPKCCEPESKKGEAAVKAEAKAEEETEKACVASKHDPVTIIETSSLMTLVKRFWI